MLGRTVAGLFMAWLLVVGAPAAAADAKHPVVVRAGPLSSALHELARQTGTELLFDEASVRGRSAPALRGRMTVQAALERLLGGTDLAGRRAASGAYIIERRSAPPTAPAAQEDLPLPDILIVGRRTQNADIRRRENDVQPYQVTTGRQIVEAHRDNLDEYYRSRVTTNTQVIPPSLSDEGETISEIDLRGLGSDGTLVLVDGRRMPSIPGWTTNFQPAYAAVPFGFHQPDVNAIPLHAIERVETLTGTAGGIYGFGALGGVVNVVLKRDYRGLALHGTFGISSRGDAERLAIEGSFGFSPNGGRTNLMLYLSHARSRPLHVGDRNYASRDLKERFRFNPDNFVLGAFPDGANSVAVLSLLGEPLSLKPEYGGQKLLSDHTYLPAGFAGSRDELAKLLVEKAGQYDLSLSEPRRATELGSTQRATSLIANLRHRFSSGIEGYFDALVLSNRGRHVDRDQWGLILAFDDSPVNPFEQHIFLTFPIPDAFIRERADVTTSRYTAGIVADLPHGWRGTAEATFGSTRADVLEEQRSFGGVFLGPPLGPDIDPFGDWEQFQRDVLIGSTTRGSAARVRNRYRQQSLRIAGPLFSTAAGPVALSLLAERRRERVPAFETFVHMETEYGNFEDTVRAAARSNSTTSFYGEFQAPLFGSEAPVPLLRNLEVQLALRHDRLEAVYPSQPTNPESDALDRRTFHGTSFTAGAKASPASWLMLRGSFATGAQPPPLDILVPLEEMSDFPFGLDVHRGGASVTEEGPLLYKSGGRRDLRTSLASTLSLGVVLNPDGRQGPRVSVDYSRIRKTRDPIRIFPDVVLQNEDFWPERVTRAPMTEEDRARGYTRGRVTMIDSRAANAGGATIDSIDARFDWPMPLLGGRLRLYGTATWQMNNRIRRLFESPIQRVGYRNGPLELRANGGADWSYRGTTIGANVQFYSRYRIYHQQYGPLSTDVPFQGSDWVGSQAYVDLHASRRFRLPGSRSGPDLTVDLGIVNLFDRSPPRETGYPVTGPGYSRYGDPRRRRFELVLSSEF